LKARQQTESLTQKALCWLQSHYPSLVRQEEGEEELRLDWEELKLVRLGGVETGAPVVAGEPAVPIIPPP